MTICPNCQVENRAGAKFCKNCASQLPVSSAVTRPLDGNETDYAQVTQRQTPQDQIRTTKRAVRNPGSGTKPFSVGQAFNRRPPGAIFGDRFLYENVIYSDDQLHRYYVNQIDVPEEQQIRSCLNPDCGAVFPSRGSPPEKYCTDCGTTLGKDEQVFVLTEMQTPLSDKDTIIIAKGLSHGSVRAPVTAFPERLVGLPRFCVVTPRMSPLERPPDTLQALKWGLGLARGLDYLHDNGIMFDGRVEESNLRLADERAVWANFENCVLSPDGYVTERSADTRALASLVFFWLTGKSQYERVPTLTPGVNRVFEQALGSPGLSSGMELADTFQTAIEEASAPQSVDHHLGRRTHVGMVRDLNEDSILTLEISRNRQSFNQPLGVYAVADGMGGHAAGEIASGAIVNIIGEKALADLMPAEFSQSEDEDRMDWLVGAVKAANEEVFALRKSAGTDMGSTLVTAVVEGNKVYITHVGDSRAYLINEKEIKQLTTDHSLVERLIATNQITREEARYHPQRNVIYRTVGDKSNLELEGSTHKLNVGDYLLLCSDGLSGMVEDQVMHRIVVDAPSPQAACDELIEAANAAGGDDNISVVLVKIAQA